MPVEETAQGEDEDDDFLGPAMQYTDESGVLIPVPTKEDPAKVGAEECGALGLFPICWGCGERRADPQNNPVNWSPQMWYLQVNPKLNPRAQ